MRKKDREIINSLLDGKLAIDGEVHQAVKRLYDEIGGRYGYGSSYYHHTINDRVKELERFQTERSQYADLEYAYEISPRTPSEDAPEETAAWTGIWWQVLLPLTEDETYQHQYYGYNGRRVIASGSAETHAEAWAAIKSVIRNHREDRLEDLAFGNMHETSGTVKW